jgi:hypothetical protein
VILLYYPIFLTIQIDHENQRQLKNAGKLGGKKMIDFKFANEKIAVIGEHFVLTVLRHMNKRQDEVQEVFWVREEELQQELRENGLILEKQQCRDIDIEEYQDKGVDIIEFMKDGREIWHEVKTDQEGLAFLWPNGDASREFSKLLQPLGRHQLMKKLGTGNLFIEFKQAVGDGWYPKYKKLYEQEMKEKINHERTLWYYFLGSGRTDLKTKERASDALTAEGLPFLYNFAIQLPFGELIERVELFIDENGGMNEEELERKKIWKRSESKQGIVIPATYFWHQSMEVLEQNETSIRFGSAMLKALRSPIRSDRPGSKALLFVDNERGYEHSEHHPYANYRS